MTQSRWVDRDGSNEIVGVYANEQSPGQEKLTDEDAEVIAFLAEPELTPIEKARAEYPTLSDLIESLVEDKAGNPGKLNSLFAKVTAAIQKHGA